MDSWKEGGSRACAEEISSGLPLFLRKLKKSLPVQREKPSLGSELVLYQKGIIWVISSVCEYKCLWLSRAREPGRRGLLKHPCAAAVMRSYGSVPKLCPAARAVINVRLHHRVLSTLLLR